MTDKPKEQYLFFAFFIAMFIIFGLLLWIIIRKPEQTPLVPDTTQNLKDSIQALTKTIEEQKEITNYYVHVVDSLESLPPVITIIYREQKKFTSVATVNQLDSIIRANSGLSPRIKRY